MRGQSLLKDHFVTTPVWSFYNEPVIRGHLSYQAIFPSYKGWPDESCSTVIVI